jgi:hypothetical protein
MKVDFKVLIASLLIFIVVVNKAFGNLNIYYFTFIIHFGFCAYISYEKKKIKQLVISIIAVFFLYFFPSYFQLLPIVALCFFLFKEQYYIGLLILSISFIDLSFNIHINEYYYSFIGLFILFIYLIFNKLIINGLIIVICLFFVSIIYNMISFKNYCTENYTNSIEFYRPSQVFNRIAGITYCDENKKVNIVRSLVHNSKVLDSIPGIIVSEINVKNKQISHPDAYWQQGGCWNDNLFSGNQFYLEAIVKDGGFYTNKGSVLTKAGKRILYNNTFNDKANLIIENNGRLYFHDSDIFSSIISNYQQNFIKEIFFSGYRPFLMRLICIIALILILFLIFDYKSGVILSFLILLTLSILEKNLIVYGELRMVGDIVNSHENIKFNSVPKSLVLSGYNYTIGNRNAKIMVVESGKKASWKGEKIIVCSSDCLIEYKGNYIKIGNLPLGNVEDLIDVREIKYKGVTKIGYMKIGEIKIIATDSPGLIRWEKYLK